jgi:hypothetical protein
MPTLKSAEKTAWKVVADPSAPESAWLPACHVIGPGGGMLSAPPSTRAEVPGTAKVVMALVLSLAAAWGTRIFVDCGFDWGYYLVDAISEQPSSDQGIIAAYSSCLLVPSLVFGYFCGVVKSYFRQVNWLRWMPAAGTLLYFACIYFKSSLEWDTLVMLLGASAGAFGLAYGGYLLAARLYLWLGKVSRGKAASLVPIVCLATTAIVEEVFGHKINNMSEAWIPELKLYLLLMTAVAFCGALFCKSRRFMTALAFASAAVGPVLLVMFLNVIGTTGSLALDSFGLGASIGWRACLSALFIALASVASVSAGAFAASRLRRMSN